jgi:hypothetical protein
MHSEFLLKETETKACRHWQTSNSPFICVKMKENTFLWEEKRMSVCPDCKESVFIYLKSLKYVDWIFSRKTELYCNHDEIIVDQNSLNFKPEQNSIYENSESYFEAIGNCKCTCKIRLMGVLSTSNNTQLYIWKKLKKIKQVEDVNGNCHLIEVYDFIDA